MDGREYATWTQGAGAIASARETVTFKALTGRNAAFADASEQTADCADSGVRSGGAAFRGSRVHAFLTNAKR